MEKFSFSWKAPEYEHRPKLPGWFWISIIGSLVLLAFAIWQRNFLFGLFILIAEVLLLVWGNREPDEVSITIDHGGVRIGTHRYYPKSHIEAFSLLPHPHTDWYDLYLLLDQRYIPTIKVHVPGRDAAEVRSLLSRMYPEYDHQESFIDSLERLLWF